MGRFFLTLHGQVTLHSNVLTDIRIAHETGYAGIEIHTDKLDRYLAEVGDTGLIRSTLDRFDISPVCIDIIGGIETPSQEGRDRLFERTERLCQVASEISCPTIQVNAFSELAQQGLDQDSIIGMTADNLRVIADIGKGYGVRFQFEGAAWTPIHTLKDCLRLIEETGRDNVGLVIDTWHFWASYGGDPAELALVDPRSIYGVHISDGRRPDRSVPASAWPDERTLRGFYPGQGEIPLDEWVDALVLAGYAGPVSGELMNGRLWERDNVDAARMMCQALRKLLKVDDTAQDRESRRQPRLSEEILTLGW